ncbi:MAG TPA: hypothetical protein VFZ37_08270 [Jiangellaceae bacterium]
MNGTKARRVAAVERYIHDLAIALAGMPVDEREDVIAGVREHIEDSLAGIDDPAPEDVERVLTSLGDPAEIAADARGRTGSPGAAQRPELAAAPSTSPIGAASKSGPSSNAAAPSEGAPPLLAREWVPIATMGMFVLAVFATWFAGPGSGLGVLFWLGGLVALVASPLWTAAEKVIGTLWFGVGPIVAGVAAVVLGRINVPGPRIGPAVGPYRDYLAFGGWGWLAAGVFGLIVLVGTVGIMAWLVTAGSKRARRVAGG